MAWDEHAFQKWNSYVMQWMHLKINEKEANYADSYVQLSEQCAVSFYTFLLNNSIWFSVDERFFLFVFCFLMLQPCQTNLFQQFFFFPFWIPLRGLDSPTNPTTLLIPQKIYSVFYPILQEKRSFISTITHVVFMWE